MKKYKLNIRIKKGLEERDFETYGLDTIHFTEAFRVKDLSVFKEDSYIVFFLEEQEVLEEEQSTDN